MFVCKKCGWLHSRNRCPRCGNAASYGNSSEVTLPGYNIHAMEYVDAEVPDTGEDEEADARELLWDAMHAPSPNPEVCLELARKLRSYAHEDYYANFVDVFLTGTGDMLNRFLLQPRINNGEMYSEALLDCLCSRISEKLYPAILRYLEKSDLDHPEKYENLLDAYLSDCRKKEREETDEKKRREQQEAADRLEKERKEADALRRKKEEERALSPGGYSKGFEYEKKDGGYVLTWIGDCEDKDILIPPVYNGSYVTGIGDKAFVGCKDIKSVTVPSGVTSVGNEAFAGCEGLESVKLPDTLETIGESAFMQCTALKTVDMPAVTTIGKAAFSGCGSLSKLTLPEGLKIINDEAFSNCSGRLNDGVMVIPSGVTQIGEKAFYGTYLSKIYIPVTVTSIGEDAFSYGTTLYYLGTESQWNGIFKDRFFRGIVHFYSASRPRDLGHFWHYDQSGKPTDW